LSKFGFFIHEPFEETVLLQCRELKDIREAAESWQGDTSANVAENNVRSALKILRNALAHNNIFGIRDNQGQIEKLTFFFPKQLVLQLQSNRWVGRLGNTCSFVRDIPDEVVRIAKKSRCLHCRYKSFASHKVHPP